MSLNFVSTPFQDALITSGVAIDVESKIPWFLKGQAKDAAMEQMKNSYSTYKSSLHMDYKSFYRAVKENFSVLSDSQVTPECRFAVANKLDEVAKKELKLTGATGKSCLFLRKKSGAQKGLELAAKVRAVDIINGTASPEQVDRLVNASVVDQFEKGLDRACKKVIKSSADRFDKKYFQLLLECSIRRNLNDNSPQGYVNIFTMGYGNVHRLRAISMFDILREPILLSKSEVKQIKENLSI